jgi:hydroxyacylglutathione hydrolase
MTRAALWTSFICGFAFSAVAAGTEVSQGNLDVRWFEGSEHCESAPQPPLQVHQYDAATFVLRENLCVNPEGNFVYLLLGTTRALLIDTGNVADAKQMPLAETVLGLLPGAGTAKLPLLVVHTHRHRDHREADVQFQGLPNVEVVGFDLASVRRYFAFADWPHGVAEIDLGGRTVDVLPAPGHEETHVVFYDRNTALLFSGDFLMPGRLTLDDADADLESAARLARFFNDRPVSHVLGGHIEKNAAGDTYSPGAQYHPNERALELGKDDLLGLSDALRSFNGFYTRHGAYVLVSPKHNLMLVAAVIVVVLTSLVAWVVRRIRRRSG